MASSFGGAPVTMVAEKCSKAQRSRQRKRARWFYRGIHCCVGAPGLDDDIAMDHSYQQQIDELWMNIRSVEQMLEKMMEVHQTAEADDAAKALGATRANISERHEQEVAATTGSDLGPNLLHTEAGYEASLIAARQSAAADTPSSADAGNIPFDDGFHPLDYLAMSDVSCLSVTARMVRNHSLVHGFRRRWFGSIVDLSATAPAAEMTAKEKPATNKNNTQQPPQASRTRGELNSCRPLEFLEVNDVSSLSLCSSCICESELVGSFLERWIVDNSCPQSFSTQPPK
eukprot:gb/GFBE01038213.1/.p1 GENE.gb/GFBE01038213.1/~~gb/GFBE01038213.1/.p1  ORF type:complete len:286 (+),score=35.91 gb/GFBE01038213.1/:1-858(+)